jgi:hypothetical protein
LKVVQYLLSSEGCASITETDNVGNTALLLAAHADCHPQTVQWLLEHGGAQITDTDSELDTVWSANLYRGLPVRLLGAYTKNDDGEYVLADEGTVELTAMLRVMVLHGGPPASLQNWRRRSSKSCKMVRDCGHDSQRI